MSYNNLGEFIARLEVEGELLRIGARVSPVLEIAEITDRMSKAPGGGKALLFENVEGSAFPVITNAFGSHRRIALALGAAPDELAARLEAILKQAPPRSLGEKIGLLPRALAWARFFPRTGKTKAAPCQEVVLRGEEADLTKLPILQCWPKDGGRFITLPVVFTQGLQDGRRNAGMYRMQVYDAKTTGMHWHIHKDGCHHFHEYRRAGRRMEVAVAVGTDPAVTYAATAPLPRGVDEMILAGFIRRRPVVMVKGVTVDIEVPAEAEFILEGYCDPEETRIEGPFGDHTGYYSLADEYPVFHLTAVTHRRNPVYSATVVGRPPMEDCYLALVTERLFLPMIRAVLPEIADYWLPWEGVFHNIVAVAIEKEFPGHAAKIISGLWGTGQMSFAKAIAVVDDRTLLTDGKRLLAYLLDTVDFHSDLTVTRGILDVLDHSSPQPLYGTKLGIDATARMTGEEPRRSLPQALCGEGIGSDRNARTAGEQPRGETGAADVLPDGEKLLRDLERIDVAARTADGQPRRGAGAAGAPDGEEVRRHISGTNGRPRKAGEQPGVETDTADVPDGEALLRHLKGIDAGFVAARRLFADCKNPLLLLAIDKENGRSSRHYIERIDGRAFPRGVCVLYDAGIDLTDESLLLWKVFNNTDYGRDLEIRESGIVIDATKKRPADGHKRPWPDDIAMTDDIKKRVDALLGGIDLLSAQAIS